MYYRKDYFYFFNIYDDKYIKDVIIKMIRLLLLYILLVDVSINKEVGLKEKYE